MRDSEIKFGTVEAADGDLTASLEALAALGARLGSPYGLAAAHILQRLEATAAARLKRRNAALIESGAAGTPTPPTTRRRSKSHAS